MRNRRHLPNWLDKFQEVFKETEAPEKYVYWSGIGTIAGALQRNVRINEIAFRIYPNHYIIFVGPPAVKKSTAMQYGVDLLREVEGINVAHSSITWQYLVDVMREIQTPTAEETAKTGMTVRDAAPIVLPASELGTLIDFNERGAIDFFTHGWDSPDIYNKGTRLMGDQVLYGPTPTIIGGTTPQWLKDNVHGATRGGGFISRCILPYANRPRKTIAYPSMYMSANHADQISILIHDLACISTLKGEYKLDPPAIKLGMEWHEVTNKSNYDKDIFDDSDNWANRRFTHVHKLAMVLAASQRDELVITRDDLQEAIARIEEVHFDFNKSFALLDQRIETKATREVEHYLSLHGSALLSVLIADLRQKFTVREIREALSALEQSKLITRQHEARTNRAGGLESAERIIYHGAER